MEEVVIPLASFAMVVAVVGIVQGAKTIRYYLDWRERMSERQTGGREGSVLQAIHAVRAEVTAQRQHESDAILTFDSTLQALDARLRSLERRSRSEGTAERIPLGAGVSPAVAEPARTPVER